MVPQPSLGVTWPNPNGSGPKALGPGSPLIARRLSITEDRTFAEKKILNRAGRQHCGAKQLFPATRRTQREIQVPTQWPHRWAKEASRMKIEWVDWCCARPEDP